MIFKKNAKNDGLGHSNTQTESTETEQSYNLKAKLEQPSRKKAARKQGVGKDAIKSKTIGSKEFKSLLDNMLVFTGSIDASKKQHGKNS